MQIHRVFLLQFYIMQDHLFVFSIKIFQQKMLKKYPNYQKQLIMNEVICLNDQLFFWTFRRCLLFFKNKYLKFCLYKLHLKKYKNRTNLLLQNFFLLRKNMPFIFHAKKQSIFDVQDKQNIQNKNVDFGNVENNLNKYEKKYKVNIQVCKNHPFRKFHNNDIEDNIPLISEQIQNNYINDEKPYNISRGELKRTKFKPKKQIDAQLKQNSQDNESSIKLQICLNNNLDCNKKIHQLNDKQKLIKKKSIQNQNLLQNQSQRLLFRIQNTPGPGSYQPKKVSNEKSTVIYYQCQKNYRIPSQTKKNNLSTNDQSVLNNKKLEQNFPLYCSYKNQTSSIFKKSLIENNKQNKNSHLYDLLFSSKKGKINSSQAQTVKIDCMKSNPSIEENDGVCADEQYQKYVQNHPSPNSYNLKRDFTLNQKDKAKYFISGSPKFQNKSHITSKSPGPGQYTNYIIPQKDQRLNRDQNSTKIGPWRQQKAQKLDLGFSSGVPRQLHFDNQNLGRQQFYYSPKNNMTDQVDKKIKKQTKLLFGSSLQRFKHQKIQQEDCFKYSLQKDKYIQQNNSSNCVAFKLTAKRELFGQNKSLLLKQNKYENQNKTISQQVERQLFKRLLRSKYQDQKLFLKQKKTKMQKILIDQKNKNIDIKTTNKTYDNLNTNKYHQNLLKKRNKQKQNISFGSNKESSLNREFHTNIELLDIYYQTQPSWNINSFNKLYGYDFYRNNG